MLECVEGKDRKRLTDFSTEIGFGSILGEDDAFMVSRNAADPRHRGQLRVLPMVTGDEVRDWAESPSGEVLFPYNAAIELRR